MIKVGQIELTNILPGWTGTHKPSRASQLGRSPEVVGWKNPYGGPAACSDVAMLRDGSAGVLWERGVSRGY